MFSTFASAGDLEWQVATTRDINDFFKEPEIENDPGLIGTNGVIDGAGVVTLADALGGTILR